MIFVDPNIVWESHVVDRDYRTKVREQRACVVWFTGLSGSGKSTIASLVERQLARLGAHTYLLDGDNVRHGLCRDLGFSVADRAENIRRAGEVSRLMADAGLMVLSAFISPFRSDRESVLLAGEFIEVFVDSPLTECERRDPQGLYKKARAGEIVNFTGIDSPYEHPLQPEIHLDTIRYVAEERGDHVIDCLSRYGFVQTERGRIGT
jgi:adenylylsulfate kinase